MFDENEVSQTPNGEVPSEPENTGLKSLLNHKLFLILGAIVLLLILAAGVWYFSRPKKINSPVPVAQVIVTSTPSSLPMETGTTTEEIATTTSLAELEKYNFSGFYQEPSPIPEFKFTDYKLPLNVKIDVLNYYDVARKINLDDGLNSLNTNGVAVLNNPSEKDINNFYGAYSYLSDKEVPLLVTSDFLLHYHQNISKQVFKDIEENVFYDNLWRISKSLYESSKNRYEARLAKIGNVNDSVLEGERLATAYFAVALKLLEPTSSQIDATGKDPKKFSSTEASNLYFTILPYLQSDAGEEMNLIQAAKETKKSPVFLYQRNYSDFVVPTEYRGTEKLYNFYLASTWLNSVFPLVVKDKACPNCLLDKEDARLSLVASSFITKDFSSDQELKNRWALVYKLISYSKGLRDDLNYLNYDDTMKQLFGDNYDPETIFAENNPDLNKNIDKLRTALLAIQFNELQGGLDKNKDKPRLGFKLLSDYYLPNSYMFNRLSGDNVGNYNGTKASSTSPINTTICRDTLKRCNGFSFDVIGLITDKLNSYAYWVENTNYAKYTDKLLALKNELKAAPIWHTNNFWSMLGAAKMIFENNNGQMQAYSGTDLWRQRLVETAAATWLDLQLPLEQLIPATAPITNGLSNEVFYNDNFYIEPNYALVQKLIADNEMMYGMLDALGINKQVSSVALNLKEENTKLNQFSVLIKKELNGESFNADDESFISSVAKQYKINQAPASRVLVKAGDATLFDDVSIKLMALVYQTDEGKFIAIGPIFSYKETR